MNVSAMLSWKEQEIRCPSLANLRLIETMSISVDSPRQMVCLHLPFFSLTIKLHSGCLTRASLGCTCLSTTLLWKNASMTYYLR